MESFRTGCIEMTWDAETRFGTLIYRKGPKPKGQDATDLVRIMAGWLGSDPLPFGLLVDCAELVGGDPEYRAIWARFYLEKKDSAAIALFNMEPAYRVPSEMFSLGTGVKLKVFATEAESRAWLRDLGIRA